MTTIINSTITPYYADDHVTIYHGNSLELADVWTCADVLVTDPPYGVRWEAHHGDRRNRSNVTRTKDAVAGDDSPEARDKAIELWGDRPAMVFGSWRIPRPQSVRALLVWNKEGSYSALNRAPFFTVHEEVYVLGDGWDLHPDLHPLRSVLTTREHRSQHTAAIGHPTPKPVDLMRRLIERTAGTIADPFMGSGSTLRAAKDLGRKAIGVELEERYCEIAAKRMRPRSTRPDMTTTNEGAAPMPTLHQLARAAADKADKADSLPPSNLTETVQAIADLLVLLVLDLGPQHQITEQAQLTEQARRLAEPEILAQARRDTARTNATAVGISPEWGIAPLDGHVTGTIAGTSTPPPHIDQSECLRVAARLEDIADDGLTEHAISPAPPRGDAHTLRHAATLLRTIGGVS